MPAEALERLESLDALVHTLSTSRKKIAFLVGSPLSMPDAPGGQGIPGIAEMIKLVRASLDIGLEARFDSIVSSTDGAKQYQSAMKFLRSYQGQDAVNTVIQEAVLHARLPAAGTDGTPLNLLDDDIHGWHLPAATRDLGKLVVAFPERFGPILTTNFDPLISVAIRKAGGRVSQTILHADGRLDAVRHERDVHSVVHLHGHWTHSDTLHTPSQLTQERPSLDASLQTLLRQFTLVVIGYSGWDDVITQALARCGNDAHANVDIVWAFYESDGALIHLRYKSLFSSISSIYGRGRFREYGGIDCHTMFKALHTALENGATPTAITPPAPVSEKPPVPGVATPRPSPAHLAKGVPPEPPASPVKRIDPPAPSKASEPAKAAGNLRMGVGSRLLGVLLLGAALFLYLRESESTVTSQPPTPERGRSQRQRESRGGNTNLPIVPVAQQPGGGIAPPRAVPISGLVGAPKHPATLDGLRSQNQVLPLPRSQMPQRASEMPEGSYGFAPTETVYHLRAAKIVASPTDDAFEFHRLRGDTFAVVGYVQEASRKAFDQGRAMSIVLAPSPDSERQQLLGVPFQRITSLGLRRDGSRRVLLLSLNETER